jgi:hypothetical protein
MNYKMTNFSSNPLEVKWFSDKKSAISFAKMSVAVGYLPTFEKFDDTFTNGKAVSFPSLAIKHFFKGGQF